MLSSSSYDNKTFDSTTYEGRRHLHKNGTFAGTLLFFKSTIGIGLLVNQYFIGKSGLIWGIAVTLFLCLLVGYTLDQMLELTNKIERQKKINIESFDQFAGIIFGKKIRIFSKVFIILYNEAVLLVNTINLCKFLQFFLQEKISIFRSLDHIKLVVIMIFLICLIFIVEPEKLKYVTYFATAVLILALIIMWSTSLQVYNSHPSVQFDLFNFSYSADMVGNLLYSFESIGTLFTVRSTLKKPKKMKTILIFSYMMVTFIIVTNSVIFLITYGKDHLQPVAFSYFNNNISLVFLEVLFYLTLPCLVFICLISNSLELENLICVQKYLRNDFGIMMVSRLMLFRLTLCYVMLFPVFLIQDEILLMTLCGGFIVPMIGFIIPILGDIIYNINTYSTTNLIGKILLLIISLLVNGVFIINTFN